MVGCSKILFTVGKLSKKSLSHILYSNSFSEKRCRTGTAKIINFTIKVQGINATNLTLPGKQVGDKYKGHF